MSAERTTITLPATLREQANAARGTQSMNHFIQDALRLLIATRTPPHKPPRIGPMAGDP